MQTRATTRLYLQDDHCFEAHANVIAVRENSVALDQTCFYPGGGGQPPGQGSVRVLTGEVLEIVSVHADSDDVIWHISKSPLSPNILGQPAKLSLDKERRLALTRYHTVLHVLNTIALRDYGGWITGVQIAAEYSRIDFRLEGFSVAMCAELEKKVNAVLEGNHALKSYHIPRKNSASATICSGRWRSNRPFPAGKSGLWKYRGLMHKLAGARMCAPRPKWAGSRSFALRTKEGSTNGFTSGSITPLGRSFRLDELVSTRQCGSV